MSVFAKGIETMDEPLTNTLGRALNQYLTYP